MTDAGYARLAPALAAGTSYTRPMPALGFDPAPGDVAMTRALARRYAEVADEVTAVGAQVARVDLSRWQGKAGTAAKARRAVLVQELSRAADTATRLSEVTASWCPRLARFQAEADALERQAAAGQANHQYLAGRATRFPQLNRDLAESAAILASIRAQARQLHHEYLAAAAGVLSEFDLRAWWEGTDRYRLMIEAGLVPFDVLGTDHWVSVLKKVGLEPGKNLVPVDESLTQVRQLMLEGTHEDVVAALMKSGEAVKTAGRRYDAFDAFSPAWVKAAVKSVSGLEWAGRALGGLGLVADASDLISPQDSGAVGWADRGAAVVNGGFQVADLLGAEAVMDVIPGVGEVAITVTGLYLAGDFLYHHFTPFRDVTDDVGRAAVKTADNLGHDASAAWHTITSLRI